MVHYIIFRKRVTGLGQVVAIASGKGGVGKSTIAAGIAASLTSLGRRVLLIDCDAGLRNLDLMLGIADLGVYNLADVLAGRRAVAEAAVRHPNYPNLYFISASTEVDDPLMTEQNMQALLAQTAEQFDQIILDCPAGAGRVHRIISGLSDLLLIVTTPENTAIRDADRTAQLLPAKKQRLIVNRVTPTFIKSGLFSNIDEIIDITAVRLLGLVPEDRNVILMTNGGYPVCCGREPAAVAIDNIAARVDGRSRPLYKFW